MAKKNAETEQSVEDAFNDQSTALRAFADLLDAYPDTTDPDEQKRIAGELHLTAPKTAEAVKKIAKYLEETHG